MRSRHRKHFDVRQEVIKTNPPVRRKGILLDPPPPPPSPVLIDQLMISLYYHADNDNTA